MAVAPRLTIVLPLKGRHLFTLRFLWHANKARLPYRFLIADGQVHPVLARLLENSRESFPELDIEYIRYPDDADFSAFYAKMSDAVRRVRTRYAMLVDNDDFLSFSGIEATLAFLDTNSDYVCSSGRVVGFAVYSGLNNPSRGLSGRLNRLYTYYKSDDVASSSAAERLRQGALRHWIYYSVIRTETLASIERETEGLNFSDLQLHETFHVMRAVSDGKARMDQATVSYLRQYGTSSLSSYRKDWVHHFIRSRFTSDVEGLVARISGLVAAADGGDPAVVAEDVRGIIEEKVRQFLWANYGCLQEIKQMLRRQMPRLIGWLQNRPRYFVGRSLAALMSDLSGAGASEQYLATLAGELALVEDTITGKGFSNFVQPHVAAFALGA